MNENIKNRAVAGIDLGSITAKAVIMARGEVLAWAVVPSGGNLSTAAVEALAQALELAGLFSEDIVYTIATGYGSGSIKADETASDISCHGLGVAHMFPSARTVVDIGGQFSRAISIDEQGRATSFVLSEKCAAGSGRLLQVIARVLHVNVQELGALSLKSTKRVDFTTGCAVFNESEAISRIAEGAAIEDIAAGVNRALAAKIQSLVERIRLKPDLALVGGGAKNAGLIKNVAEKFGQRVLVPEEPQITAALGAALLAEAKLSNQI